MTTAASAEFGRLARSPLRNTSNMITTPAPTTPASWLLAPDCSATAVRELLAEMANPRKKPAAMLAEPIPIISLFGFTRSPRRVLNEVDSAMVSVRDTSVMPTAATSSGTTSSMSVHGTSGVGSPLGRVPTVPISRSNTAVTMVAPTTATSTAGIFRVTRGSTTNTASVARPTPRAVGSRWSKFDTNSRTSSTKVSASVEKPLSFGSCPTMMMMARPFM